MGNIVCKHVKDEGPSVFKADKHIKLVIDGETILISVCTSCFNLIKAEVMKL